MASKNLVWDVWTGPRDAVWEARGNFYTHPLWAIDLGRLANNLVVEIWAEIWWDNNE